jgi:FixJ family two-component response regulator
MIMPDMSGKALVDELKKAGHKIDVLFISGYINEAIYQRGEIEDGIPFLQKPFTLRVLVKKVREVLESVK